MLTFVRKKQKSVLIKLAFVIIILSFIIGYAMLTSPGDNGEGAPGNVAVTVNGHEISTQDFQQVYSNIYRLYQNVYGNQFTPALEKQLGLRQQALDQVIDKTLLLEEADRMDLEVSHQELVDAIAQIPEFQDNGAFSKDRYVQILSYQRMTPDQFEAMQEGQLLLNKVREKLVAGVQVNEEDIENEFKNNNEKVDLALVRLSPALYESRVEVTEPELQTYFTEHREEFRIPDQVAIRYLQFDPAAYLDEATLDEAELDRYYQRHLAQFDIPEQVDVAHVLIRVPNDADDATREKKRELAEKVLAEARAGKDFADLARKYSDDKASVAKGGDLGYFTRGTMVAPFEEAAFQLQPGELSEVVETPFGFHVIKGGGYIEAGIKPMVDVIDEVKAGLKQEKSRQLAFEKAMDAYNVNRKTGDLDAAAKAENLGIKESGLFARSEPIDGLGNQEEIAAAAFALADNELARPINLPQGVFLITLKERRESYLPELAEVRPEVEQEYRKAKGKELARKEAEKILAEVRNGKTLAQAAADNKAKVEESGDLTRSFGAFIPRLGNAEALSKVAFELTAENPAAPEVYEVGGNYVVAALKKRTPAKLEELTQAKRDELRQTIQRKKEEEALTAKLNEIKAQATIMIAPAIQNMLNEG